MVATGPEAERLAALKKQLVGKTLHEVPTPSIVLDLAKLEVNCQRMMDAASRNGIGWRAHIKTHKTEELTRLQVGDDLDTPANIIVSTILEAENITPLLQEYQARGRKVNILYSFPLYPSILPRLARISHALGPGALSLMVDHPDQIPLLERLTALSGSDNKPLVFLKVDVRYHRAGVIPGTQTYHATIAALLAAHAAGACVLHGLYAHAGQSYYARHDWAALAYLTAEFTTLRDVAADIRAQRPHGSSSPPPPPPVITLSVGATPTATALQHPEIASFSSSSEEEGGGVAELSGLLRSLRSDPALRLEVHAGVYPTLDLQQLATHARDNALLDSGDIAVSVVAEVASLYAGRGAKGTDEALVNAGSLALGREPCAEDSKGDYSGWGVVMPWGDPALEAVVPAPSAFPAVHGGWQVGRISQEHGILVWKGDEAAQVPLRFGQRVRIWPNHACIAGAGYDHYLVVDSRKGEGEEVVDVWRRWNGW